MSGEPLALPNMKVLVVDDTATNRQILQAFLRKLKFVVISADDGAQAVDRFRDEQPDIVLMDVMMPVMDGFEATRRIKAASTRWVPVVFLSALDKEENLVAGLDAGGDDYLAKPINFVILEAKLRSLVRTLGLQRRLDEEVRRIAAITDNIVDGVMTIDERGIIQWWNPVVENIFGYSRTELLGQNVSILMPDPYRARHDGYLRRYLESNESHVIGLGQRQVTGLRKDGTEFPMELGVSEMQVDGVRQFVGVLRDISARFEMERVMRDTTERLQAYHDAQEAENQLAHDIAMRQMLRQELGDPHVHHWVVPAANFSGDIIAATRGPNDELYVLLADATGHGLGAAISTLPVLSVFYSLAETGAALAWIVTEINRQLQATMPVGRFVAATMICIDHERLVAEAWQGGTPDLLLIDDKGALKRSFVSEHLPLGIDGLSPEEASPVRMPITAGDQFVLFSDGLIEAQDRDERQFGLGNVFAALASAPPDRRVDALREALTRHVGEGTPHDDVSLLIIDCG